MFTDNMHVREIKFNLLCMKIKTPNNAKADVKKRYDKTCFLYFFIKYLTCYPKAFYSLSTKTKSSFLQVLNLVLTRPVSPNDLCNFPKIHLSITKEKISYEKSLQSRSNSKKLS